jgi:site-specific recombinase XerD/uncharacterized coiled-coil protein SlyX
MNYWIGELANKAPGTRLKYQDYFTKFCVFTKKTPNELIEQRKVDLRAEDPREQRGIECLLKAFMVQLKDQGNSPATQQVAFAAVKSFFESNEYPLRTKRSDYPKGESLGSRAITKQLIKQILDDTKRMRDAVKMRALLLFLKDTGLRISDVRSLDYGHVRTGLEKDLEFIPLQLVTQKAKTVAKTFVGPEAIEALKLYLEKRRKGTRRMAPETITDDSPLFRTNKQGSAKRISRQGLSSMIRFQCLRTGTAKLSAHSFRKYLQTSLDAAGVSPNFVDQIIGHKLLNSRGVYSLPTDEQLLTAYKDAYPQVRIYPDKTEVEERVSKLEDQLTERNGVIADLMSNGNKKNSELANMKTQVATLKTQMDGMMRLFQAITEQKGQSVKLQNPPPGLSEVYAWKFPDEDAAKIFGVPIEKIEEAKEKLRQLGKQRQNKQEAEA